MNYEGQTRYLAQAFLGTSLWAYLLPVGTDPASVTRETIFAQGARV